MVINGAARAEADDAEAAAVVALVTGAAATRGGLANVLGVSKATASRVVERLQRRGWVEEAAPPQRVRGQRGRPPAGVRPAAGLGYVVGADLEGLAMRACVLDAQRRVVAGRRRRIDRRWGPGTLFRRWRELVEEVLAESGVSPRRLVAVGLALPGVAWPGSCRVRAWLPPGRFADLDAGAVFAPLGVPVRCADNTLCVADYERRFGAARRLERFALVLVRYGLGGVVFAGGAFVVGDVLPVAEVGHLRVDPRGAWCVCGRRGCLDALVSGRTWPAARARRGAAWRAELRRRARWLGAGLAAWVATARVPHLMLHGIYNEYSDVVRPEVSRALDRELGTLRVDPPQVVFGRTGEMQASLGAALRAAETELPRYLRAL